MPPRILISGGASPKFRISKPDVNVETATAREDFIIREDDVTVFYPDFSGSFSLTNNETKSLALSPVPTETPIVFLKSSNGYTASRGTYFAWLSESRDTLYVHNKMAATITVYYYVYGNKLTGL